MKSQSLPVLLGRLVLLGCLFVLLSALPVLAQNTAPPAAAPQVSITLGHFAVALNGPWKFAPGDSPFVNGKPLWAQPGFDDSKWVALDLAPKAGSIDPAYGTPGFVPGWTKQGFPDFDGFAWYRLRVRVTDSGEPLWIKMPNDFDDAYQLFANGQYVGRFGEFLPHGVETYSARTFSFPLPTGQQNDISILSVTFSSAPEEATA